MSRRVLAGWLVVATSFGLGGCGAGSAVDEAIQAVGDATGSGGGGSTAASVAAEEETYAHEVFNRVNIERERVGVAPLVWDEAAAAAAASHATDMAVRGYFDHVDPDGRGPGDRLAEQGITGRGYGENIAMGQRDPKAVMDDWMASEGHRQNILSPSFVSIGVGVHFGSHGPWWVQDFLMP